MHSRFSYACYALSLTAICFLAMSVIHAHMELICGPKEAEIITALIACFIGGLAAGIWSQD